MEIKKNIVSNKWLHFVLLFLLLCAASFIRLHDPDWIKSLRFVAFDTYNQTYPRAKPEDASVVIVDIDEKSMADERLGQWPWSRNHLATLVNNLNNAGAKAIAFDMVFAEKDRTSPINFKDKLKLDHDLPDYDQEFSKAIKESNKTIMGFVWTLAEAGRGTKPFQPRPLRVSKDAHEVQDHATAMIGSIKSLTPFERAAAGNGNFGVSTQVDGVIRQVPLVFRYTDLNGTQKGIYPSLAIETIRVAQNPRLITKIQPQSTVGLLSPPYEIDIGDFKIPMDQRGQIYTYFRDMNEQDYLSATDIIHGTFNPDTVKDRIILIGTSAEGLKDIRSTPLDLFVAGVEVHANIIEQIQTGTYLLRPFILEGAELLLFWIGGLLAISLAPFIGAVTLSVITFSIIGVISLSSWYGFIHYGFLIDPVFPSIGLLMIFMLAVLLAYIRTEADRRLVKQAFGMYISPDYMKELTENPESIKLGGQERELTVMFTDIRKFSTISERLTSQEMITLMNEFLTPMSDLVMENRGTIDKYIGDAMMAFWNAPLDDPDHARHACLAALGMQKSIDPLNAALKEKGDREGYEPILLRAGIGINTGPCSVGNMGSKQRFAYSALGDAVNLASRLEGRTKALGVDILIGENTFKKVSDLACLEMDLVQVVGREKPERIFTLLGDEEMANTDEFVSVKSRHDAVIDMYRAQKFKQAREAATKAQISAPNGIKGFYTILQSRCSVFIKTPPAKNWDGVWIAQNK